MHVPPRPGAGPQTSDAGGDAARHGEVLPAAAELSGREPGQAGAPQDSREGRQGDAVLHEGIRPESGR